MTQVLGTPLRVASLSAYRRPTAIPHTWTRAYVRILAAADAASGTAAAAIAYLARFGDASRPGMMPVLLALLVPVLWVGSVAFCRAYEERFAGSGTQDLKRLGNAAVRMLAAVALLSFAFKLDLARGFTFPALTLAATFSLTIRAIMRGTLAVQRKRQRWVNRVVVVGTPDAVVRLAAEMRRKPHAGLVVVGACTIDTDNDESLLAADIPPLGKVSAILAALRVSGADTVAVASCPEMEADALRRLAWRLEGIGVDLLVAPLLTDVAGSRIHVRPVAGLPLLHVEEPELSGGRHLTKGVFDRLAATVGLVFLLPLLAVIAVGVRLSSTGPVFFRQERVGKGGRRFRIWKFRSMVDGAERKIIDLTDMNIHGDGPLFKIHCDPRVTPFGSFLRRFSLDELPQLINVSLGHMSLVGPRPPLPEEVARYDVDVHRRLLVKPGITGLWQVSGRSDLAWDESVRLDLHYVENWSLAQDIAILGRTLHAVVAKRGAY